MAVRAVCLVAGHREIGCRWPPARLRVPQPYACAGAQHGAGVQAGGQGRQRQDGGEHQDDRQRHLEAGHFEAADRDGAGAPGRPGLDSGGQLAWPKGSTWVLDLDGGQVQHSGYPSPLRLQHTQAGYY